MRLSKKVLDTLKKNIAVRHRLGLLLGKGDQSIVEYIKSNNIILTSLVVLDFIRKETGLSDEEIIEQEQILENA